MQDFETMYKEFNLEKEEISHLNKLASRQYPFEDGVASVVIETVIVDRSGKHEVKEGAVNA